MELQPSLRKSKPLRSSLRYKNGIVSRSPGGIRKEVEVVVVVNRFRKGSTMGKPKDFDSSHEVKISEYTNLT